MFWTRESLGIPGGMVKENGEENTFIVHVKSFASIMQYSIIFRLPTSKVLILINANEKATSVKQDYFYHTADGHK